MVKQSKQTVTVKMKNVGSRFGLRKRMAAATAIITVVTLVSSQSGVNVTRAADTGLKSASATHAPNNWTGAGNAFASDNVYATSTTEAQLQGYSTFAFGVPAGARVDGIQANIEAKASDSSGCQLQTLLSWDNGATFSAQKTAALTGSDSVLVFGGAADAWGHTWSSDQTSDANFVLEFRFDDASGNTGCDTGTTASVDQVQVKISYTALTTAVANPTLPDSCGFDVALVIDSSASVDSTELASMKTALHGFVSALSGTPTQFSVTDFDTVAHTPVTAFTSNLTTVNNAIDAATSGGNTNWQDGLLKAQGTFENRPANPNLVIFASDGNPNRTGNPAVTASAFDAVNAAVTVANSLKTTNSARILALGIGNDLNVDNLKAISGPNVDTGVTSDVVTTDFSTLATDFSTIAKQLCGGTITVTKKIDNEVATDVWHFNLDGSPHDTTAGQFNVPVLNGSHSVQELSGPDGFHFVSASCVKNNDGTVGTLNPDTLTISGITVGTDDIISCTFVNSPNSPTTGGLTVHKVANGGDATFDFSGSGAIGDFQIVTAQGAGDHTTSNLTPGPYSVTEGTLPANWSETNTNCSPDGGVQVAAGQTAECTITNTFTPPQGTHSISGMKFNDLNGNGVKDAEDPGLAGWTIFLDTNDDGILNGEELSTVTAVDGDYSFSGLADGSYNVREVMQGGWTQTLPGADSFKYVVVLNSDHLDAIGQDFGNHQNPIVCSER